MSFQFSIFTERLLINPLSTSDDHFILELLNTEGWIKFIGNRNIHSQTDASAYIQKILNNENLIYWIVKVKDNERAIGIVTFIKRDYLEYHDIGFAFLPEFSKKGYAYEATKAVLNKLQMDHKLTHILATTMPENKASIELLTKLGFAFEKEIEVEKETVLVYAASLIE
ncbi:MAG: GNAT family N-acetyltransferase [Ginsengibacter sp.]